MFKIIFAVIALYLVLQFALGVNVNEKVAPLLAPVFEMVEEETSDSLPELGKKFFDNLSAQDLGNLIESSDFDLSQVTEMLENNDLSVEQLQDLIESQDFDTDAAKEKLEQLKQLVQEKLEENQ